MHTPNPGYIPGDRWFVCDRCGRDGRVSDSRKEWTGLIVHSECFEMRHPQDFVRTKEEKGPQGPVRSVPANTFVSVTYAEVTDDDVPTATFGSSSQL